MILSSLNAMLYISSFLPIKKWHCCFCVSGTHDLLACTTTALPRVLRQVKVLLFFKALKRATDDLFGS
jgi:hypothetical protein